MRITIVSLLASFILMAGAVPSARADVGAKAAREAAEYVMKKFGVEVAQEGTEVLSRKIAVAVSRHGDDVLSAVRRVGPKALSLADDAGEQAPKVLRLLSRHGDDAAVWVLKRPKGMNLLSQYGDDAAEVLIKHKALAEPVLEQFGGPAVKALGAVGPQGGRRLAMMAEGGELAKLGRTAELMDVIASRGDVAMDFIWRHKGPLAVGTSLTAFLANPGAFIDGTNQLVGTVADATVKPVVQETARTLSSMISTLLVLLIGIPVGAIYFAIKHPKTFGDLAKMLVESVRKARPS